MGKRERWGLGWGEREWGWWWKSGEEREVGVRMGRKRVGVVVEKWGWWWKRWGWWGRERGGG